MDGNETAAKGRPDADSNRARAYLQRFLQDNAAHLQSILCGYVARIGLAGGDTDGIIEVLQRALDESASVFYLRCVYGIVVSMLSVLKSCLVDMRTEEKILHVRDEGSCATNTTR